MTKITQEDWEIWRANGITEAVFALFASEAERAKQAWVSESWDRGRVDPAFQAACRERANVFMQLCELSHDDVSRDEP